VKHLTATTKKDVWTGGSMATENETWCNESLQVVEQHNFQNFLKCKSTRVCFNENQSITKAANYTSELI